MCLSFLSLIVFSPVRDKRSGKERTGGPGTYVCIDRADLVPFLWGFLDYCTQRRKGIQAVARSFVASDDVTQRCITSKKKSSSRPLCRAPCVYRKGRFSATTRDIFCSKQKLCYKRDHDPVAVLVGSVS